MYLLDYSGVSMEEEDMIWYSEKGREREIVILLRLANYLWRIAVN